MKNLWIWWKRAVGTGTARPSRFRPTLECLEDRAVPSGANDFTQINLASDLPNVARIQDPNLVNPWGLAMSPTGPFWLAENGAGVSDILDGEGEIVPLVVGVPATSGLNGNFSGSVFNGGTGFVISANGVSKPALFLFANEDGVIFGWNGEVNMNSALEVVDNSAGGASYKGLALATNAAGQSLLYAANFTGGTIDVFDQNFKPVVQGGAFHDPNLPAGFAPFNIQNIGNLLYVSYARPKPAEPGDAAAGAGLGFIDVYNTSGDLVRRLVSGCMLNAPWGMTLAPADFGSFGGDLLVGNHGNGRINAYDPVSGAFLGQLANDDGTPIAIPTLWALTFGNGHAGGNASTLFFTAGLHYESHGLFGAIQPPQLRGADTGGAGGFNPNAPGEPGDYPLPPVNRPSFQGDSSRAAGPTANLLPWANSSLALVPTLSPFVPSGIPVNANAYSLRALGPGIDEPTARTTELPVELLNAPALVLFLDQSSRPTPSDRPLEEQTTFREVSSAESSIGLFSSAVGKMVEVEVPQDPTPSATDGHAIPDTNAGSDTEPFARRLLASGLPIVWISTMIYWHISSRRRIEDREEMGGEEMGTSRIHRARRLTIDPPAPPDLRVDEPFQGTP